ncbi:MAG: endonuclease MutS2 [Dehalococcoidales bacterium]
MDEKSLEILGFNEIRQKLAGYASFSASRELILELIPVSDFEKVSVWLKQSEEARHLLLLEPGFSVDGASDIRETAEMAALGKIIEPVSLIETGKTLAVMRRISSSLQEKSKEFPSLWEISKDITGFPGLEKDITRCLSPNGDVLDNASKELVGIRRRLGDVRQELRGRLEAIIRTPEGQRIVQEPLITEREGRYVIPVKAESRRSIEGITHDVSNTGATLFVEPMVTIELGNTVRELISEEKREVERILRSLSMAVGAHETEILTGISRLAELDSVLAKARYAREVKACEPHIMEDGTQSFITLVEARHPLLGRKAVPLSIEIGRDFSTLIITGPNTGGKTVALKTIGLLALMTQAGIPIPAAPETRLRLFDEIFADIGDEQSIEQTLSSFSWHIKNIVRILENATAKSLVLLDELGTSTDPAEGSALARSVLLHLLSSRIMTVATTHYSDLKAFAHTTEGIQNASFDFNPDTLTPTYHLTLGIPGGSNALVTAERLGVSPVIIDKARTMLSEGALNLDAALADVMAEKQKIQAVRELLETEKSETEERKTELESKLSQLRDTEQHIIQEARDRVVREAAELQRQIRQVNSELRKQARRETVNMARQTLADTRARLDSEEWTPKAPETEGKPVSVGDTVYLRESHLKATVLSISKKTGEVELQAGQIKIKVGMNSLEKAPAGTRPTSESRDKIIAPPAGTTRAELDLRGKRADEVEIALDSYLNDAALSNLNEVLIIHGIATGTVRQIARDFLTSHPLVKSFRAGGQGEGGDGATVVNL